MRRALHGLVAIAGAATLLVAGMTPAGARGAASAATCSGGDIASTTYASLTVTGACTVPEGADVTVLGNLTVAPNAMFDAQTDSHVVIGGNVLAGPGSLFGLGCTTAHPCNNGEPPAGEGPFTSTSDVVKGNVILDHVFDAALNGDWIGGNLVSTGGGAGPLDPEVQFVPFSVKDDHIAGNVVVTGLDTVWFGIIRSTVGGNVVLMNDRMSDRDGNEVATSHIGGNLICKGNAPANQLGDAIGDPVNGPNVVGKHAIGQCAGLTG